MSGDFGKSHCPIEERHYISLEPSRAVSLGARGDGAMREEVQRFHDCPIMKLLLTFILFSSLTERCLLKDECLK